MATLRENNAQLTVAVDQQKETISALQAFQIKQNANVVELQQDLSSSESIRRSLEEKFLKHDLEYLARNKPALIERRLNTATADVFNQIEQDTGAASQTITPSSTVDVPPPLAD